MSQPSLAPSQPTSHYPYRTIYVTPPAAIYAPEYPRGWLTSYHAHYLNVIFAKRHMLYQHAMKSTAAMNSNRRWQQKDKGTKWKDVRYCKKQKRPQTRKTVCRYIRNSIRCWQKTLPRWKLQNEKAPSVEAAKWKGSLGGSCKMKWLPRGSTIEIWKRLLQWNWNEKAPSVKTAR